MGGRGVLGGGTFTEGIGRVGAVIGGLGVLGGGVLLGGGMGRVTDGSSNTIMWIEDAGRAHPDVPTFADAACADLVAGQ